jgi:hypothetical protein
MAAATLEEQGNYQRQTARYPARSFGLQHRGEGESNNCRTGATRTTPPPQCESADTVCTKSASETSDAESMVKMEDWEGGCVKRGGKEDRGRLSADSESRACPYIRGTGRHKRSSWPVPGQRRRAWPFGRVSNSSSDAVHLPLTSSTDVASLVQSLAGLELRRSELGTSRTCDRSMWLLTPSGQTTH